MHTPRLVFLVLVAVATTAAAQPYPANHPNLWGRSIGSQNATFGLWSNPATIPIGNPGKRFRVTSGIGVYYNDSDALVEAAERVERAGEELEAESNQGPAAYALADKEPLISALKNLDGRVLTAGGGGGTFIPMKDFRGWDLMVGVNSGRRTATSFDFDPQDEQTLRNPAITAFRSGNLVSRLIASGVSIKSFGVSTAKTFAERGPDRAGFTRVGITIKSQEITLFDREIELDEFEEGELTQTHRNVKRFNHPNIDIGIFHRWQNWHVSGVASNLNGRNFLAQGEVYKQGPGLNLAVGYSGPWGAAQVDFDALTRQPAYGSLTDERRVRFGIALPLRESLQLRAAYHRVITGRDDDAGVLGLGWRVSDALQLQSALVVAGEKELGLSLEMTVAL